MREIKFRAWNKNLNIMVYENEDNSATYLDGWFASDVQVLNQTLNSQYELEKYKFMQYTGLKDKNGKEIYEGDILENIVTDYKGKELWKERYIIKENICGWEIRNIKKPRQHRSFQLMERCKVIGNIYDNPELLEV